MRGRLFAWKRYFEAMPVEERRAPVPSQNDVAGCDFEDTSDGIDWDDIIATTQEDFLAGRFAFNSADYPTDKEAMIALDRWFDDILQKVLKDQRPR
jgi:hypothetical protein